MEIQSIAEIHEYLNKGMPKRIMRQFVNVISNPVAKQKAAYWMNSARYVDTNANMRYVSLANRLKRHQGEIRDVFQFITKWQFSRLFVPFG